MNKKKEIWYFVSYYVFDQTATGFGHVTIITNRAIEDEIRNTNGEHLEKLEAQIAEKEGLTDCKILFFQRL